MEARASRFSESILCVRRSADVDRDGLVSLEEEERRLEEERLLAEERYEYISFVSTFIS